MFVTSEPGAYFPNKQNNTVTPSEKFPINKWPPAFIVPFPRFTPGQAKIIKKRSLKRVLM